MPANLTPDYHEAEERFRKATSPREKLDALEEMMAHIPKHKGTEKMQADIKKRMAKLKEDPKKGGGAAHRGNSVVVTREGAAQVMVLGPPNSGKSSLVDLLTKARPEIAPYPHTTRHPLPGMMEFENVQIQLVDMPPVAEPGFEPWIPGLVRTADAALVVIDPTDAEVIDGLETMRRLLEKGKIYLYGRQAPPMLPYGAVARPAMLVANKMDRPGASDDLAVLQELLGEPYQAAAVSCESHAGLEEMRGAIFRFLSLVRVYTKAPGKAPDRTRPTVVPKGSTVVDLATLIHRDFAERLKFARVWGSQKHDGQLAHRDHVLEDEDVVEFHA